MTLQSQTPRTSTWRTSSTGGGNLLPKVLAVSAVVVVMAIIVFFWSRSTANPGKPVATDLANKVTDPTATPPAVNTAAPSTPAIVDPTVAPAGATTSAPTTATQSTTGTTPPGTPPGGLTATNPNGTPGNNPTGAPAGGPISAPESGMPRELRDKVDSANKAMQSGGPANFLEARTLLNSVLADSRTPASERRALRSQIAAINDTLIFSPTIAPGDPFADSYTVASGDNPITIVRKQSLPIDARFLQRINGFNPKALRIGQKLKLIRQPFHAVVHKDEFRMDVYMGPPPSVGAKTTADGADEGWTYVRSFPVGLGESNGTPEGPFVVRPKSKLVNPLWKNPRTGEVFEADNPKNPIGEFWVGLDGADESTRKFSGYGIHGTIDLDSIGQQRSMGCVRMLPDDVALVYEIMMDRVSTVRIIK